MPNDAALQILMYAVACVTIGVAIFAALDVLGVKSSSVRLAAIPVAALVLAAASLLVERFRTKTVGRFPSSRTVAPEETDLLYLRRNLTRVAGALLVLLIVLFLGANVWKPIAALSIGPLLFFVYMAFGGWLRR